ncbi:peptidase S9 [Tsuneonella deserti]|uniref:Peptidase S9 n=1 Tax=Tsuneonella deserti TaxID=2035528 RepID=A0ABQ1RY33_9SPHN|nr:DPP IV N-terminal domain-containing protein [Tsuneonella deserti]GGD84942.1 peptidase S9 [Tsuneonella deserti]
MLHLKHLLMAFGLVSVVANAQDTVPGGDRLTPERVFADPDLSGPSARGVRLSPDGTVVTYLKAKPDNQRMTDLWAADVKGGAPRLLVDGRALIPVGRELSEAEKSRRERQGIQSNGVVDYSWDDQGRFIVVPVQGDIWLFERAASKVRQLTDTAEDEIDAKVSPKGRYVSFVRGDNLFIVPSAGGDPRAITTGGTPDKSWATAEFIAQEELDRDTGYWWAPGEDRIALAYVDQTGVDIVPRPDIGAEGATIVQQRYPRVGRPNAKVDLYIASVADGARIKVDLGPDPDIYLARVDWSADGRTLYVQRLSRDQKTLDLLGVDPSTGSSRVLLSQTSPHWVELTHDFKPLKGGDFLWSSEASGNRHLYRYAADGRQLLQLTSGNWPVGDLLGVDEAKQRAFFLASKDSPIEQQLYSVSYTKSESPIQLTQGDGWWSAQLSKTGGAFAGTFSNPTTPPQTALYRADGSRIRWIEENRLDASHPYWPYRERLRTPEFGTIDADDGQKLWWSMRTPPGFDPAKKYPVVVQVYGGPAGALVNNGWMSPRDQLWLEAGYILFTLDNRGTPNRSVAFKTAIDRRMGELEVADQLSGVAHLKTLPFVDGDRIGVTGWSNGGYMTLMLLTVPDSPYAAGIAGAPPTDWTLYDTAYTERYLGTPASDGKAYENSEVTARLDNMEPGSLLLIHGMADDNVTFDNSTRLMAALQARSIPFEMQLYPGLRHRAGWSQATLLHRTLASLDFFARKLKPVPAP